MVLDEFNYVVVLFKVILGWSSDDINIIFHIKIKFVKSLFKIQEQK